MATALMVSWNWRKRMMPAYTLRPHFTADTMLVKLLSISRMSDASFAMDVPTTGTARHIIVSESIQLWRSPCCPWPEYAGITVSGLQVLEVRDSPQQTDRVRDIGYQDSVSTRQ